MEVEHIKQTWHELAGRRNTFVEGFYGRLFERHPGYREKFPDDMSAQMEHMVEMVSSVARYCDHMGLIEPYLRTVGYAHRGTGIHDRDVQNFRDVFIESLSEAGTEHWDTAHEQSWREAFDDVVIPMFDEGLELGRS